ncbi:MAG: hypothetical protein H0A76_05700 [Candidatus Thiodubiliella endoseptemdiera]|uniref:Uncharacterized protein n=1 Tax=Candidatus Thiodubiliella endoseptemdiera TaxID=2738886 RepID=A0A853F187_9GAMM|nr:hypothetical protein [Candidatus Thiodubiliella endoseptemdiera]
MATPKYYYNNNPSVDGQAPTQRLLTMDSKQYSTGQRFKKGGVISL